MTHNIGEASLDRIGKWPYVKLAKSSIFNIRRNRHNVRRVCDRIVVGMESSVGVSLRLFLIGNEMLC
jgi:hypothetical protein